LSAAEIWPVEGLHDYGKFGGIGGDALWVSRGARRIWFFADRTCGDRRSGMGSGAVGAQGDGKELENVGIPLEFQSTSFRALVGAPERADAEVEKDSDNAGSDPEGSVVAGVMVGLDGIPERRRKDQDGQQKEDARDFEPEDSTNAAKGTQETTDAAADRLTGLAKSMTGV
jgi:hypothetical protein